jgi:hypothetical protein
MCRSLLIFCLALAYLPAVPLYGQQINRCTDAQGRTVYGDRRCEDMGASTRLPAHRSSGQSGLYRDSCARRLSDLVGQIQSASDARDVNRLAGVYWWSGLSSAAAGKVIERLDAILQRPLVDIAPVFPEPAAYVPPEPAPFTYADGTLVDGSRPQYSPDTSQVTATPYQRPRPIGLRLEQTLANSATPARTTLWLRRQYNCFWISL